MKTANFKTYTGVLQENQDIEVNKYILYTFMNSAGNTSAYASDGKVPVAPTQAAVTASSFSNATGTITIGETAFTTITDNTKINVYEDNDGTYDSGSSAKKNWITPADNSIVINTTKAATDKGAWAAIAAKPKVGYSIETTDGNESDVIFDTHSIPVKPTLNGAAALITAGNGGTDAPAGYVNNAGKTSVKLTPGVALTAGQKLTLKVNKTNSAIMSATIASAAVGNVTPVFGTQNANVTFATGNNGGNTTTGAFDFTVGSGASPVLEGTDVAVTAIKTAVDGNESDR